MVFDHDILDSLGIPTISGCDIIRIVEYVFIMTCFRSNSSSAEDIQRVLFCIIFRIVCSERFCPNSTISFFVSYFSTIFMVKSWEELFEELLFKFLRMFLYHQSTVSGLCRQTDTCCQCCRIIRVSITEDCFQTIGTIRYILECLGCIIKYCAGSSVPRQEYSMRCSCIYFLGICVYITYALIDSPSFWNRSIVAVCCCWIGNQESHIIIFTWIRHYILQLHCLYIVFDDGSILSQRLCAQGVCLHSSNLIVENSHEVCIILACRLLCIGSLGCTDKSNLRSIVREHSLHSGEHLIVGSVGSKFAVDGSLHGFHHSLVVSNSSVNLIHIRRNRRTYECIVFIIRDSCLADASIDNSECSISCKRCVF